MEEEDADDELHGVRALRSDIRGGSVPSKKSSFSTGNLSRKGPAHSLADAEGSHGRPGDGAGSMPHPNASLRPDPGEGGGLRPQSSRLRRGGVRGGDTISAENETSSSRPPPPPLLPAIN